ncbi:Tah11p [Saccharomyces cerevisiae YJM1573]|uniref:K7_Tah11p n=1 Tax=Saccharomyces cerevisiae (strain Kyokai no. 7 / NBRC 101557) TaxID=721032 RepID=G2WH51_YEASK|nr:Tah11p [Saccharomyces cerevisiae YJM456]AJR70872.1 Tah11p [Saccharomyces cerevisiae YJM1443]AJR71202.1 Tah11p [Saccharomyces cerevisiae YJM1444]AJR74129.1 Tah11p [Saccharomyces cerevisiae YJM1527]AJR74777.1 Tah11p [Saccharomyces cerevisiae YJM1573]AJR75441.1 Tah11p [Saccharomyces cerevisiae YJM1592]AJV40083.1 Tah11p [Saccharomyces cerevisiae YJM1326]AJV44661.1 Tah11p [Saccharomyces cerevisiae YJM1389]AJV45931.1 Tah11p [Saccharomyces cerevisiae YJM1402]CAI4546487.1 AMM_1a_G0029250.mRNA.1
MSGTANSRRKEVLRVPVIDLNRVSDEEQLLPVVRAILLQHDTFLLKNYANKAVLDALLAGLTTKDLPDTSQGFDANFTGTLPLEDDVWLEQYIFDTDPQLRFDRKCRNESLCSIYSRLFKLGLFFAQLCVKSVVSSAELQDCISSSHYATKLTRYFNDNGSTHDGADAGATVLPTGDDFQYLFERDYVTFLPTGVLTIFPCAKAIRYKPSTMATTDNSWVSIDEPDCLLFHTGTLLARWSQGMHTTSPLQIDPRANIVSLTIWPPLTTPISSKGEGTIANHLLEQQIKAFPKVAQQYYPRELSILRLQDAMKFVKELFTVCETVLSLNALSRSTGVPPELHVLLPQISSMMKRKIVQDDILKLLTIWSDAYVVELNSRGELTMNLPKRDNLTTLTNKSRTLAFVERAESWYQQVIASKDEIMTDVPAFKINKRRSSSNSKTVLSSKVQTKSSNANALNNSRYLANSKENFMYKEKMPDSQANLMDRLRERERRSAALLSQRQKRYQQFLAMKMTQVFDILFSLTRGQPYTETYLSSLIVDSLQDSNNPIGTKEASEILAGLQGILPMDISVHQVDGGLKVYRWNSLDKNRFSKLLQIHKSKQQD